MEEGEVGGDESGGGAQQQQQQQRRTTTGQAARRETRFDMRSFAAPPSSVVAAAAAAPAYDGRQWQGRYDGRGAYGVTQFGVVDGNRTTGYAAVPMYDGRQRHDGGGMGWTTGGQPVVAQQWPQQHPSTSAAAWPQQQQQQMPPVRKRGRSRSPVTSQQQQQQQFPYPIPVAIPPPPHQQQPYNSHLGSGYGYSSYPTTEYNASRYHTDATTTMPPPSHVDAWSGNVVGANANGQAVTYNLPPSQPPPQLRSEFVPPIPLPRNAAHHPSMVMMDAPPRSGRINQPPTRELGGGNEANVTRRPGRSRDRIPSLVVPPPLPPLYPSTVPSHHYLPPQQQQQPYGASYPSSYPSHTAVGFSPAYSDGRVLPPVTTQPPSIYPPIDRRLSDYRHGGMYDTPSSSISQVPPPQPPGFGFISPATDQPRNAYPYSYAPGTFVPRRGGGGGDGGSTNMNGYHPASSSMNNNVPSSMMTGARSMEHPLSSSSAPPYRPSSLRRVSGNSNFRVSSVASQWRPAGASDSRAMAAATAAAVANKVHKPSSSSSSSTVLQDVPTTPITDESDQVAFEKFLSKVDVDVLNKAIQERCGHDVLQLRLDKIQQECGECQSNRMDVLKEHAVEILTYEALRFQLSLAENKLEAIRRRV